MTDKQEPKTATSKTRKLKKKIIPASAVLNFAALFILFTMIIALQYYGQRPNPSAKNEAAPPAVVAETNPAPPAVAAPAEVPAPEPAVKPAETAEPQIAANAAETPPPEPASGAAEVAETQPAVKVAETATADELNDISEIKPPAIEIPKADLPQAEVKKLKAAGRSNPKAEVAELPAGTRWHPRANAAQLPAAARWSPEMEREISVELLDNEGARQNYLAANRGLPVPKEVPIASPPAREFIPFEKK